MEFRRNAVALLTASVLVALANGPAESRPAGAASGGRPFGGARPASAGRVSTTDIDRHIDVNNINLFVTNFGAFGYDLSNTYNGGMFYPKGTDRTAIYAAGLWLGCTVRDTLRVTVAEYGQEYNPGRILGPGSWDPPGHPDLVVWKVARYSGDPQDTAHVDRANPNSDFAEDALVHHGWGEYVAKAKPFGAPTRIYRLPDTSTPAPDDSLDVEGPDVVGDMMTWCVYNDADPGVHTVDAGNTAPMNIQIEQTTFAFNRQGALGNTVFIRYKFKNAGTDTLENMYVSQWSDPDLGGFTDDLVGCDTLPDRTGKPRSLGFVYNSVENDQIYGSPPPAVGFDFFKGPTVAGVPLPMTSFAKYINGTDPHAPEETYAWMSGLDGTSGGTPIVDPYGNETRFMVAGDPVAPGANNWLDTSPADRRFFLSSGPFTMNPGDEQEVVVAIIAAHCGDRLTSITALRAFDDEAQAAFDNNFSLASPPNSPGFTATTDHSSVTLSWDGTSRDAYGVQQGYRFEGYNVYQGATAAGPWKRVATYDEFAPPTLVVDQVFSLQTCENDPGAYTAYGSNSGIQFHHGFTTDQINGGPLRDATTYHYAVSAYSYNPTGVPKVLESGYSIVSVIPQREASGTDVTSAAVSNVTYLRKDTNKPPATDVVTAEIVQPENVTGHVYKVVFEPLSPPFTGTIGNLDNVTAYHSWSIIDSTTGVTKLSGRLNRNADEAFEVVDGVRVKVTGKYAPQFQEANYLNDNTAHRRALTGVNWGLPGFFGGAGAGWDFFGGTIDPAVHPDSFTTVELRFSGTNTQNAYRFLRRQLADGTGQGGYDYAGFHPVNMQAWDVVNDVQLDLAFVERVVVAADGTILPPGSQLASFDSTWAPSDDALGDREYLFVIRRPYDGTAKAEIAQDASIVSDVLPLMWVLSARKRAAGDVIDDGDRFQWVWANPAKDNDVYTFNTTAMLRNSSSLAKSNLERIRAVPNPYYARSTYESNQFNRRLRFLNLPEVCTIRIFNLAGQLVRTLEKTDPSTSILQWDLETRTGLPVGSGVFIYHVEVPGVGEYRGRLVIFMEKERLNNF
jgi:hypothetical protein